jgi:hypothetical protein
MLDSLFVAGAVAAIGEAIASAHAEEGTVAVIGNARLASVLAKQRTTLAVGLSARAAKKTAGAVDDLSGVEPRSLAAVIAVDVRGLPPRGSGAESRRGVVDVATDEAWQTALSEWSRVVRDGGVIVLVDRGHAADASRRALCGGLTELEQRRAGRSIVTSGLVSHLV